MNDNRGMPRYVTKHGMRNGDEPSATDAEFLARVAAVREDKHQTRTITMVCATCGPITKSQSVHVVENAGHVVTMTEITVIVYRERMPNATQR